VTDRIRQIRAHGTVSPGVASALSLASDGRLDLEMRDQNGDKCWWAPGLRVVAVRREPGGNRLAVEVEVDLTLAVDPRSGKPASPPRLPGPPSERSALVPRGDGEPGTRSEWEAERAEILRLWRQGIPVREIALRVGRNRQRVGSMIARNMTSEERRLRDHRIRDLARRGVSHGEIARVLGTSVGLVRRVLEEGRRKE